MADITMETYAQLEVYKNEERKARREMANALKMRLSALQRQQTLIAMAAEYPIIAELYASQMVVNPAAEAALGMLAANVMEDWGIMLAMQEADSSIFFGKVPAMPVVEETPEESEEGDGGTALLPPNE